MQIQLCKYCRTAHRFFLLFLQIFFLVIPVCSFFMFSFLANWKISLVAFISIFISRHWDLFHKIAAHQDVTKTVCFFNFFYKIGVSLQYSLLNRKFINILKLKSCAGIPLGLQSKSWSGSFTEQLVFLHSFEWLLLIIHLICVVKNSAG